MRDFVDEELELATRSLRELPRQPLPATDEVLSVLEEAREWLDDPERWLQGRLCSENILVTDAGKTCAWGAILRSARGGDAVFEAERVLSVACGGDTRIGSVIRFNDDPRTTHADVLALFDRAIASRTAEVGK